MKSLLPETPSPNGDDMTCEQVRGVIEGKVQMKPHEQLIYVRHIRSCRECRFEIPADVRAKAIHAIITDNE